MYLDLIEESKKKVFMAVAEKEELKCIFVL
jgi:hypothetical protein